MHKIIQEWQRKSCEELRSYFQDKNNDIADEDLISFIKTSKNRPKKIEALLRLMATAELSLLKKLNDDVGIGCNVDVGFSTAIGNTALMIACENGRADLLSWLIKELHLSVNPNSNYARSLLVSALQNQHIDLVRKLIQPEHEGGFGFSLAEDHLSYGIAMQAANAEKFIAFTQLIKPVAQGGLGVPYSRDELINFPYDFSAQYPGCHPYVMTLKYKRENHKGIETLTLLDMEKETTETYQKDKRLGEGSYGCVYAFTCDNKKIAVKVPQFGWIPYLGADDINEFFADDRHEFEMLCMAYPDEGPYAIQSLRGKSVEGKNYYTWRMMMPFVPGDEYYDALISLKGNNLLAAKVILRTLEELQKIHGRGVMHGDIRPGNIMVNIKDDKEVSVHFIDFGFACKIGETAPELGVDFNGFFAPERAHESIASPAQDIWSLARTIQYATQRNYKLDMSAFPSVKKFAKAGLNIDPALRPSLTSFIEELRQEIENYALKTESKKTVRKVSNFIASNRFFVADRELQKQKPNVVQDKIGLKRW